MKTQGGALIPFLAIFTCSLSACSSGSGSQCRASSLAAQEFDLCPSTWDQTVNLPCRFYEDRATGTCDGDRRSFSRGWGSHDVTCYYANSTGALVGATRGDDIPEYCNGSSSTISAGQLPACTIQPSAADGVCKPDSGSGVD